MIWWCAKGKIETGRGENGVIKMEGQPSPLCYPKKQIDELHHAPFGAACSLLVVLALPGGREHACIASSSLHGRDVEAGTHDSSDEYEWRDAVCTSHSRIVGA